MYLKDECIKKLIFNLVLEVRILENKNGLPDDVVMLGDSERELQDKQNGERHVRGKT